MVGYSSEYYYRTLDRVGQPLFLPRSQAWGLVRNIPNTSYRDLSASFPFLRAISPNRITEDFADLPDDVVTAVVVTDPFSEADPNMLNHSFNAGLTFFKKHYVVNVQSYATDVHHEHLNKVRTAFGRGVTVHECYRTDYYEEIWGMLWDLLVSRHGLADAPGPSRSGVIRQLRVPGTMCVRAQLGSNVIGMVIFYIEGSNAYYHLGAYSEMGYDVHVSYAIFWNAFSYLRDRGVKQVSLGGNAGMKNDDEDGLAYFKRGWASHTVPVYIGKSVLKPDLYDALCEKKGVSSSTSFFPAYRQDRMNAT